MRPILHQPCYFNILTRPLRLSRVLSILTQKTLSAAKPDSADLFLVPDLTVAEAQSW